MVVVGFRKEISSLICVIIIGLGEPDGFRGGSILDRLPSQTLTEVSKVVRLINLTLPRVNLDVDADGIMGSRRTVLGMDGDEHSFTC